MYKFILLDYLKSIFLCIILGGDFWVCSNITQRINDVSRYLTLPNQVVSSFGELLSCNPHPNILKFLILGTKVNYCLKDGLLDL